MARKPLPSAVLKHAPAAVQAALIEFLNGGATLAAGVAWLQKEHGIKSNDSSMSEWRDWYLVMHTIDTWSTEADEFAAKLRERGDMPDDLVARIAEAVFLSRATKDSNPKVFAQIAAIIQRDMEGRMEKWKVTQQLDLKRQQIALQREDLARKVKLMEAQITKAQKTLAPDSKLTDAERVAKMRAVFGR
jgi:hypothetical protein